MCVCVCVFNQCLTFSKTTLWMAKSAIALSLLLLLLLAALAECSRASKPRVVSASTFVKVEIGAGQFNVMDYGAKVCV